MLINFSCSRALRAPVLEDAPPRVASHSVLLTRGYVCVALRAGFAQAVNKYLLHKSDPMTFFPKTISQFRFQLQMSSSLSDTPSDPFDQRS